MATTSITLQVDEEAAHSTPSLREVMDTIGRSAQERGLTAERLQEIL